MFNDPPNASELLLTVREYIEQLLPDLEKQNKYHGLCCTYLLDVVMRELEELPHMEDQSNNALKALLNNKDKLSETEFMSSLCASIRSGEQDGNLDRLLVLLTNHVSKKVRVSNPDYLDAKDYLSSDTTDHHL
ncbi:MAG: DUF6285 domain-containing protein [Gammaproteobacteria bacterium]|nr:DUF6285 domain-containing protein [Gammaproteobacteria bacterium]